VRGKRSGARLDQTFRMHESVLGRAGANICEKGETPDVTVLIRRVLGHLRMVFTDCLALDSTKVGGLFLGFSRTIFRIEKRSSEHQQSLKLHRPTGKSYTSSKSIPIPLNIWFSQRGRERSELVRERNRWKKGQP
jgi:hypothetical protein